MPISSGLSLEIDEASSQGGIGMGEGCIHISVRAFGLLKR
jgi:hypothetical protein